MGGEDKRMYAEVIDGVMDPTKQATRVLARLMTDWFFVARSVDRQRPGVGCELNKNIRQT